MQSNESGSDCFEIMIRRSQEAASIVGLIDESILLLLQKRRTLEEKAIINHFHKLAIAYGSIISHLHLHISKSDSQIEAVVASMDRLRTVNENVASSLAELLKILKYNFNFLEQYFEYDYCSALLNDGNTLNELELLQSILSEGI